MESRFVQLSLDDIVAQDVTRIVIISVNKRHARRLLSELATRLDHQKAAMAVPNIMPLSAWLNRLADELAFHDALSLPEHVASAYAARCLWEEVIIELEAERPLLDSRAAARLAQEADSFLAEWSIETLPGEATPEYLRFQHWRARYHERLHTLNADDTNTAFTRVCDAIQQGIRLCDADTVVLAGFHEVSPRLQGLLRSLCEQGLTVAKLSTSAPPAQQIRRIQADDLWAEWALAAQWARTQLMRDPHARYAIVAPQLEEHAPLAHRILRKTLSPAGFAFNVAVARPLAQWPLVRAALAWTGVLGRAAQGHDCSSAQFGEALLNGYCAGHRSEAGLRAQLDARWRHDGVMFLSDHAFANALESHLPLLAAGWRTAIQQLKQAPRQAELSEWVPWLHQCLSALGFPGDDTTLDSVAYQSMQAFADLIDGLARQSHVLGKMSLTQCGQLLARAANDTPFQPQRDPTARLDVLGLLEAEGGRWDGVWILGLTDEVLPAHPRPNPLLPLASLRRLGAPRATPERELEWAQTLYDSLLCTAPTVHLSYPAFEGERVLRPSPLLGMSDFVRQVPEADVHAAISLEHLSDDWGPSLLPGDTVSGGIAALEAQARNPLWAFVRFRLGARELPDYSLTPDARVRGQFIHEAMQLLWSRLQHHDGLLAHWHTDELTALVHEVSAQAARSCLGELMPVVRTLEVERAHDILTRWLAIEAQRLPFDRVLLEHSVSWVHADVQWRFRVDRIDRLVDGRLLVMDYKTGASPVAFQKNWLRARPIDLQLPLYASILPNEEARLAGLAFVRLHAGVVDAIGLSDGDCGLDGLLPLKKCKGYEEMDWSQMLAQWRASIQSLASEFCAGFAANRVVDKSDLRYCDVLPFLRLNEEPYDVVSAAK